MSKCHNGRLGSDGVESEQSVIRFWGERLKDYNM